MKNKILLTVLAVALLIAMTACSNGTTTTAIGEKAYYGTWSFAATNASTIVITGNEFKFDFTSGIYSGSKLYFTITKWTAVENTDTETSDDYPKGYKLEGSVNTVAWSSSSSKWIVDDWNTVGGTTPIYVFMHKDGSKIGWGNCDESMPINKDYIKQN